LETQTAEARKSEACKAEALKVEAYTAETSVNRRRSWGLLRGALHSTSPVPHVKTVSLGLHSIKCNFTLLMSLISLIVRWRRFTLHTYSPIISSLLEAAPVSFNGFLFNFIVMNVNI